jgi:hypothetical protein
MNKLIIGLLLGENTNTLHLQSFAKSHGYKYIKIGGIDAAHMATVNNLNQAEYWARVYAEAFADVRSGLNVVLDMDYFQDADISELCTLAKDNGVLHVQGFLPNLKNSLDLLGGEKTVSRVLENENINIQGLDSLYVEDLNVEIIKNISSVSSKFAESPNVKVVQDDKFYKAIDSYSSNSFLAKYWDSIVLAAYSLLGIILLGILFWLGNSIWQKWQNPVETKVVYTGPKEIQVEPEYVNTNAPIFIEDVATPTEEIAVIEEPKIEEVATPTEEIKEEVKPVQNNNQNVVNKYGRIKPEYLAAAYCCTDGTFRQWYTYVGEANYANLIGDIYYVKTNESVYAVNGAVFDRNGKMIGGNAYKITGADPNTFYLLNDYLKVHNFARDDNHVYYKGSVLEDMDPFLTMLYCPAGTLQSCFFNDGLYNYSMINGRNFRNNLINTLPR